MNIPSWKDELNQAKYWLEQFDPGNLEVGMSVNTDAAMQQAINFLNQLIQAGQISGEQARQALSDAFGLDVVLTKNLVPFKAGDPQAQIFKNSGLQTSTGEWLFEVPTINSNLTVKTKEVYAPTPAASGKKGNLKDEKKIEDEVERYHEINEELEDLERNYSKAGKAKERAYGQNRLKAIDKEIDALEDLIDKQEDYVKAIEINLKADFAAIEMYGFKRDAQGRLLNYEAVFTEQVIKFNQLRTEAALKEFEMFKKLVEQYEETLDSFNSAMDELEDLQYELQDKRLEKITTVAHLFWAVQHHQSKVIQRQLMATVNLLKCL